MNSIENILGMIATEAGESGAGALIEQRKAEHMRLMDVVEVLNENTYHGQRDWLLGYDRDGSCGIDSLTLEQSLSAARASQIAQRYTEFRKRQRLSCSFLLEVGK
jgi:hypothetical protein